MGCVGGALGALAPKLKPEAIGWDGVVDTEASFSSPFVESFWADSDLPAPRPNPKPAEVDRGLAAAKENNPGEPGVPGVAGAAEESVEPMLNEKLGSLLGVFETAPVGGALNRNDGVPLLEGGDGTTMDSPIAALTVGLMAKMLECFCVDAGVAGASCFDCCSFSFSFSFSCSCLSMMDCAKRLAWLVGRFSGAACVEEGAVEVEGDAPKAGKGVDDVAAATGVVDVAVTSFFSAACPKLNPAKGEGFGALLSDADNVGLKPEDVASDFDVPLVEGAGSLKPPTVGKAGAFVDVGREGLNPPADDDVDVAGAAGSLKPPALGILGGAGIAKDGLEASVVCFLAGAAVAVSSMVEASRFFGCGSVAVFTPPFPAFFLICSRYSLYSALTPSSADAKLTNGSSRILTDKA